MGIRRLAEPQAVRSIGIVDECAHRMLNGALTPASCPRPVGMTDGYGRARARSAYFLAVAKLLSFTQAAEILYVSQPALSKQIRALERQLRVTMFERRRGAVQLTRAGAELVPPAERIVANWEDTKQSLSKASECTLVIGMHTSPGRGLLPRVRAMLVASCPDAEFELRHAPWSDRTAGLSDQSADAAFVWLPLPQPPYQWVTIAREPRLVALPNDHRLATYASVSMTDLLDEPFLALPESAGPLRDYWLALDQRDGPRLERAPLSAAT